LIIDNKNMATSRLQLLILLAGLFLAISQAKKAPAKAKKQDSLDKEYTTEEYLGFFRSQFDIYSDYLDVAHSESLGFHTVSKVEHIP
jgi:hypothetical protein